MDSFVLRADTDDSAAFILWGKKEYQHYKQKDKCHSVNQRVDNYILDTSVAIWND